MFSAPRGRLTQADCLLLAAATSCCDDLSATFSEVDLTMQAWKLYPETFCIPGHRDHADRKAISSILSKAYGPVANRYMERVNCRLRLTVAGLERAALLQRKVEAA